MERYSKLESLFSCLALAIVALASSMQIARADSIGPPTSQILPGVSADTPLIAQAQQNGWPNSAPQWQQNSAPSTPGSQNYQQSGYPSQDMSQQNGAAPSFGNSSVPIQQGFQGGQQQSQMQYGQAQQSAAPGWQADYPNPNDPSNSANNVPMDNGGKKKGGVGSMIGKALGGVAKMAPTVAGAGMAGMTNMAMGNMMYGGGMGGYGMGGYGYGGGYGMPGSMMMNGVFNQGLRMLQSR
ncbi:MAG TPA: hypothetical protein V6C76_03965 [Drouetiella sp.]